MKSVNKVFLLGNLTADPEMRHTTNNVDVTTFTVATSESWGKAGEKQEKTEFHRCVAWRQLAEIVSKYAKKGQQVFVEGKLTTRKYEKDGQTHYSTEVVADEFILLGGGGKKHEKGSEQQAYQQVQPPPMGGNAEDDLPF